MNIYLNILVLVIFFFCRAGLPVSDKIWNKKNKWTRWWSIQRITEGRSFKCQGPDERSQSAAGARHFGIRQAMGGDECVVM